MVSKGDDIGHPNYNERLKKLGMFSLYGRLLRADIIKYIRTFMEKWMQGFRVFLLWSLTGKRCERHI